MTDIVERLRKPGDEVFSTRKKSILADEIERLRAEIAKLRNDAMSLWMMLDDIDIGGDIAKADDVLYRAIAEKSHKRRFWPQYKWVMDAIDEAGRQQ